MNIGTYSTWCVAVEASARYAHFDEWERHQATRTVASLATDGDDLADLLDMLGLTAAEGKRPTDKASA